MVIKSDRIDGILPRGLLMLTLGLAASVDSDLGKGSKEHMRVRPAERLIEK
jgi:hypothetical protein